jgi:curli biogenesis system outer membrane secretion channel CsgG
MSLSLRIQTIAIALLTLLIALPSFAARPSIAVLPFSMDKQVIIARGNAIVTGVVEDESNLLTSELIHQLVATRKFDVLERARLDDLLREKELQESDYADPAAASKIAKLLGVDYFIIGRIDGFDVTSTTKSVPYSSQTYQQQEASLDVYLRVIDAHTGRIVAAEKFNKEAKVRINAEKKTTGAGRTVIAQSAQEMVGRITDNVFPLRVIRVEDNAIYLNRGNDGRLKMGDHLLVFSQGKELTDSDTGESVGFAEEEVGEAEVSVIDTRFTKATLIKGKATEGMRVRKLDAVIKPAPKEELPAGPRW